jgi:hypothetical protein
MTMKVDRVHAPSHAVAVAGYGGVRPERFGAGTRSPLKQG